MSFINLSGNNYGNNFSDSLDDDSICPFCPKLFNFKEA